MSVLLPLGLSLDIPDDQWKRLLVLIGNEGEDVLLDRVIASRSPERKVGSVLLYPKPYGRLLAAVDAPADSQAVLLSAFVKHWYKEVRTGLNPALILRQLAIDIPIGTPTAMKTLRAVRILAAGVWKPWQ